MIDLAEGLQHVLARLRKVRRNFDKASACVSETVADDNFQLLGQLGQVPRQRITHLDWRLHRSGSFHQDIAKIFSGVLSPGEEQRDLAALTCGDNAAGEDAS